MKGINIWEAETFEEQTRQNHIRARNGQALTFIKARPIGPFNLSHRLWCALKVWKGEADIITFYNQ